MVSQANVIVTKVKASDVDEHAAALAEWNQRYLQLARGRFSGRLQHIEINDGLKLFRETTNLKISEYFVTPKGRLSIGVPLPGSAPVRCCHQEAGPGDLIVFRPDEGYHLECRGAFDVIGIEIDDTRELDFRNGGVHITRADTELTECLIAAINQLANNGTEAATHEASKQVPSGMTGGMASLIRDQVCQLLSAERSPAPSATRAPSRLAIVARARSLIAANCQEPISVSDLARTLAVSTRTLEYSFQDVLDTSPATYIKIVRLHEARRAIRNAESSKTVTDVAVKWGFWHFGRFASDYRKLFGELPSQTRTASRAFDS